MSQSPANLHKTDLASRCKAWILRRRHGAKLLLGGELRIMGKMPVFKIPGASTIRLGDKVVLNSDFRNSNTALTYRCTLVCGTKAAIEIGDNTMLNGVAITAYSKVSIGRNCQIASGTIIADTDFHPVDPILREKALLGHRIDHSNVATRAISIGDNVWIGWGAIVLKGVTIGDNSIVAAGSVVLSDVPPNVIVAGNPAAVKKNI